MSNNVGRRQATRPWRAYAPAQEPGLSSDVLRAIIDFGEDAVLIVNSEGRCSFANEAACRLLGYSRHELARRTVMDIVAPEAVPRLRYARAQLLRGATHLGQWSLRRKNGSRIPVDVRARIQVGGGWQVVARDMSERNEYDAEHRALLTTYESRAGTRLDDAMRRIEPLLTSIFEILPVGLWVAHAQGRVVRSNAAGRRIWDGEAEGPVLGPHDDGHALAEPASVQGQALAEALRSGLIQNGKVSTIECADGSRKTVVTWAAPIRSEQGAVVGAIAVDEDVTLLQESQDRLRAVVREREEILAKVAHDLRNPLHGIQLDASMLAYMTAKSADREREHELAASLLDASRRMSGLVDDLLAISVAGAPGSADAVASMIKRQPVLADELLARARNAAEPIMRGHRLDLVVRGDRRVPLVNVDPDRILRVFVNLLDNAAKFTAPGGTVTLTTAASAGQVLFSVANSGDPLPLPQIESMFQAFWQANRDTSGAGLGLSICRSIVEAHGGKIWAEPARDRRVNVVFTLPRTKRRALPSNRRRNRDADVA